MVTFCVHCTLPSLVSWMLNVSHFLKDWFVVEEWFFTSHAKKRKSPRAYFLVHCFYLTIVNLGDYLLLVGGKIILSTQITKSQDIGSSASDHSNEYGSCFIQFYAATPGVVVLSSTEVKLKGSIHYCPVLYAYKPNPYADSSIGMILHWQYQVKIHIDHHGYVPLSTVHCFLLH